MTRTSDSDPLAAPRRWSLRSLVVARGSALGTRYSVFATVLVVFFALSAASLARHDTEQTTGPGEPAFRYAVHLTRVHDAPMRLVAEAGFDTIIQLLSWREIEPTRGELYWEYPDSIVRSAEHYDIQVVLRLDQQPAWARPGRTNGPPADLDRYAEYVEQVATRYRGRVAGYIVWNEPNLAHEWGGDRPDPERYADLLSRAAARIRQADPRAKVIAAGLAPTNETSPRALDDREFLRRQLAAPGGREFDILAGHAYGFGLPPDTPVESNDGLNFNRVVDQRRILQEHGIDRPIWLTEVGWTIDPTSPIGGPAVDETTRARYLQDAFGRARGWPWAGMLAVWSLGADEPDDDNQAGFRLAGPGYRPGFTWEQLKGMAKGGQGEWRTANGERTLSCQDGASQGRSGLLTATGRPTAVGQLAATRCIEILAPDVVIHLGDQPDLASPWRPIHGFGRVVTSWRSEFYVAASSGDWQLEIDLFQPNDRGNRILINGQPLDPQFLTGRDWDFASYWTRARLRVPPGTLRPGLNILEIRVGQWVPSFQVANNLWEDLQFRNVRLKAVG